MGKKYGVQKRQSAGQKPEILLIWFRKGYD